MKKENNLATITINGKTCKIPADRLQGIAGTGYCAYGAEAETTKERGDTSTAKWFGDMANESYRLYIFLLNNKD